MVVAPGSVVRTLPIPGLAEQGIGFKTVGEAIFLRNHVLARLDFAASVTDEALRRKALTFVFVGGGYAGVEAFAELEDMARYATRYYPDVEPEDMRWVLVEATGRILPEVGVPMSEYTVRQLLKRDHRRPAATPGSSRCVDGHVVLSDGEEFDAETIVWTAGVKAHPMLARTDLPLDAKGRLVCTTDLRVAGVEDAWSAGDCAAVPDLTAEEPGVTTSPTAQHAVRQAKPLAANIVATLRHRPLVDYKHKHVGSVASLGLLQGRRPGLRRQAARAGRPGSCTGRTTSAGCRRSTASRGCWPTGRWLSSSRARWSRSGSCSQPRQEFQQAAQPTAPDGRATDVTAAPTTRPEPTTDGRRAG